jgi:hypothetical protein
MSSSARTPQSVLDAPHLTPVVVAQSGQNRVERRQAKYRAKGKTVTPKRTLRTKKAIRHALRSESSTTARRST